jgi:excisionase family DNA binding protein
MLLDNKQFLLLALTPEELQKLISETLAAGLSAFATQFGKKPLDTNVDPSKGVTKDDEDLLTRDEVRKLLKISAPTLRSWVNSGKLNGYEFAGKRIYFKKSEIIGSLEKLVPTRRSNSILVK